MLANLTPLWWLGGIPRLRHDVGALRRLIKSKTPPKRLIIGGNLVIVCYGFGDAAGGGFGASWEVFGGKIKYRFGVWGDGNEG